MRATSKLATCSAFAVFFVLCGCSSIVQTTSGQDYLHALPPIAAKHDDIDQRVRDVADVEPILRFPGRIGLARIGNDHGHAGLIPIPATEAEAWSSLADDLGPEYGEFVPVSPLVAALVASPKPASERMDAARETVEMIRLAAARQHLDAVFIYEADSTADSKNNPLSIADWTLIGLFVIPSRDVKAEGIAQGALIDVRNGYHYGSVQAKADDKRISSFASDRDTEHDLSKRVEGAAVANLVKDTRGMMRQLKVRLAALDKTQR